MKWVVNVVQFLGHGVIKRNHRVCMDINNKTGVSIWELTGWIDSYFQLIMNEDIGVIINIKKIYSITNK